MEVHCEGCGELHDIEDMEPSLKRPEAYLAVPAAERDRRTKASEDFCVVDGVARGSQWFVRSLLPVPVLGLERPCCWGLWCEVSARDFATIQLLWNDQVAHAPFAAKLANDLDGYPPSVGLPGSLRFLDPTKLPYFELAPEVDHLIAGEARSGVTPARVLEWLAPLLHGSRTRTASNDERWPFDQAPDVAAITTRYVIEDGLPVLLAVHYSEDDSWGFFCGTSDATEDGRVISMEEALRRDPTLRGIADLPPGWSADRETVGGEWARAHDPEV